MQNFEGDVIDADISDGVAVMSSGRLVSLVATDFDLLAFGRAMTDGATDSSPQA